MPQDTTAPFEVKQLALEIKADAAGVIEGYGSVFGGVDAYGDTIEPGAFTESLGKRQPPASPAPFPTAPAGHRKSGMMNTRLSLDHNPKSSRPSPNRKL